MTFLYAARDTYDEDHASWQGYLQWSKLTHLKELVSLDGPLNGDLVEPDYDNGDDWNYIHVVDQSHSGDVAGIQTGFYTSLDYVFKKLNTEKPCNLLTVVIEPDEDCRKVDLADFEFVGYDLLDKDFCISALSNCGGFDETFVPSDLNDRGLIDTLEDAYDIKRRLLDNNPDESHADTNVIAVWRHKTV
jgi:hypothetical protein